MVKNEKALIYFKLLEKFSRFNTFLCNGFDICHNAFLVHTINLFQNQIPYLIYVLMN